MNFTSTSTSRTYTKFTFVLPFNFPQVASYIVVVISSCFFGVIGNVITIATVQTSSRLKSTWYQLITSLAVSDLISAIASPLVMYSFTFGYKEWNWPAFLCKLSWGLDMLTTYVTTMHILWFAILRFVSLQWPHRFQTFAENHRKRSILTIWMIAFLVGFLPFVTVMDVVHRDRSLPVVYSQWSDCGTPIFWISVIDWYIKIIYPLFIYIPFVLIIIFSVGIGIKVVLMQKKRNANQKSEDKNKSEMIRRKKEKQIVLQVILIVGSFLFGYFPTTAFHFFLFAAEYTSDQNYWNVTWQFRTMAHVLLRISECLNPVFYNLSSSEMRRETMNLLKKIKLRITCSKGQNQFNIDRSTYRTDETKL